MIAHELTALEHLERYSANTLDRRSLEILRAELVKELAFDRAALLALEQCSPLDESLPAWRSDVTTKEAAVALIDIATGERNA